jgi:regulator of cell morphogenesis and NO signaling
MTSPASKAAADSFGLDVEAGDAQAPAEIIGFIVRRFHEPLRRELPTLVASARMVESATLGRPLAPLGLAEQVEQMAIALDSHLAKEEKILFPLILAGRGSTALMPIKVMMAEHDDHAANLRQVRAKAHDFALPEDAAPEWRALYARLQALEVDLRQHIALENDVLFPRAMGSEPGEPANRR